MMTKNISKLIQLIAGIALVYFQKGLIRESGGVALVSVLILILWSKGTDNPIRVMISSLLLLLSANYIYLDTLNSIIFFELSLLITFSMEDIKRNLFSLAPTAILLFLVPQFNAGFSSQDGQIFYLLYFISRLVTLFLINRERMLGGALDLVFLIGFSLFFSKGYQLSTQIIYMVPAVWLLTIYSENRLKWRFRSSFLLLFTLIGFSTPLILIYLSIQYLVNRINNETYALDINVMPLLVFLIVVIIEYFKTLSSGNLFLASIALLVPFIDKSFLTTIFIGPQQVKVSNSKELLIFMFALAVFCF